MVDKLRANGIEVIAVQDTPIPHTPDSIFPNNWVSFHDDGTVVLYPMFAENRRAERRADILQRIESEGFSIRRKVDYTGFEEENRFLEGTGGIILDRVNRYAYAALSQRVDEALLGRFCKEQNFIPVSFHAYQTVNGQRLPIYHTNVMMCVATDYAVVCLDSIETWKSVSRFVTSCGRQGKKSLPSPRNRCITLPEICFRWRTGKAHCF